jgi:hypothetical protein
LCLPLEKELLPWIEGDTVQEYMSDIAGESSGLPWNEFHESRVEIVERHVRDLEAHTEENTNQIQHVATEIQLSRKDVAEVLALLRGSGKAT